MAPNEKNKNGSPSRSNSSALWYVFISFGFRRIRYRRKYHRLEIVMLEIFKMMGKFLPVYNPTF